MVPPAAIIYCDFPPGPYPEKFPQRMRVGDPSLDARDDSLRGCPDGFRGAGHWNGMSGHVRRISRCRARATRPYAWLARLSRRISRYRTRSGASLRMHFSVCASKIPRSTLGMTAWTLAPTDFAAPYIGMSGHARPMSRCRARATRPYAWRRAEPFPTRVGIRYPATAGLATTPLPPGSRSRSRTQPP